MQWLSAVQVLVCCCKRPVARRKGQVPPLHNEMWSLMTLWLHTSSWCSNTTLQKVHSVLLLGPLLDCLPSRSRLNPARSDNSLAQALLESPNRKGQQIRHNNAPGPAQRQLWVAGLLRGCACAGHRRAGKRVSRDCAAGPCGLACAREQTSVRAGPARTPHQVSA